MHFSASLWAGSILTLVSHTSERSFADSSGMPVSSLEEVQHNPVNDNRLAMDFI